VCVRACVCMCVYVWMLVHMRVRAFVGIRRVGQKRIWDCFFLYLLMS